MAEAAQAISSESHAPAWKHGLNDHQVVLKLMKRMGSKSGYDPLPPDQHKWQRAAGEPAIHRMWSWMCAHTVHWGHRSEYAVNVLGETRTLQDMAEDLGMDEDNLNGYWREGEQRGLWRRGGVPADRRKLYLCGTVAPSPSGEEKEKPTGMNIPLPPYLLEQTKGWPDEKVRTFTERYQREEVVRKMSQAELIAVVRQVIATREDTLFREFGLEKVRIKQPTRARTTAEAEARDKRQTAAAEAIDRYVQTCADFVQTLDFGLNNATAGVCADGASLLPQRLPRESQSERASLQGIAHPAPAETPHLDGKNRPKQQPAEPSAQLEKSERKALAYLFTDIRTLQRHYDKTPFGRDAVNLDNKADVAWGRRVLQLVPEDEISDFCLFVRAKFGPAMSGAGAIAKQEGRPPGSETGPRSLGLILAWAGDWNRSRSRRQAQATDESAAERRRVELERKQAERALQLAEKELREPWLTEKWRANIEATIEDLRRKLAGGLLEGGVS